MTDADIRIAQDTLADIRKNKDANTTMWVGTDDTTPAGTFAATAKILGIVRTYLLTGTPDQDNAPIIGHIANLHHGATFYVGNGVLGGTFAGLLRGDDSTETAFARIADKARAANA